MSSAEIPFKRGGADQLHGTWGWASCSTWLADIGVMCLPRLPGQGGQLWWAEGAKTAVSNPDSVCLTWGGGWGGRNEPVPRRNLESHPHVPGASAWAAQPKQSPAHKR